MKRVIYITLIAVSFICNIAYATDFTSVVVFGDSHNDGGNDETAITSFYKTYNHDPFPPDPGYPHVPANNFRFADDLTFSEYLGQTLNVYDPATFFNYSIGGMPTSNLALALNGYYTDPTKTIDPTGLYMIPLGQVDVLNNVDPDVSTTNIINGLQDLYDQGARHFMITNVVMAGELPTYNGNSQESINAAKVVTQKFNDLLAQKVDTLSFKDNIYLFDVAQTITTIRQYPQEFNFSDVLNACITSSAQGIFCSNIEDYLYWDTVHISSHAHRVIADLMASMISIDNNHLSVALLKPDNNISVQETATLALSALAINHKSKVIDRVEFYDDGNLIHTDNTVPYTYDWQANTPGDHALTAIVYDDLNQSVSSTPINVTVTSDNTNTPPIVSLGQPQGSTSLTSGSITATASDADGSISKVEFYVDNNLYTSVQQAPYTVSWQSAPDGTYTVTAIAYDNLDTTTTSNAVTITIDSSIAPNIKPTITLNQAVATTPDFQSGSISADAADSDGSIAKVEFYANGALLGTITNAPYALNWSNAPVGTYTATAIAYDDLGDATTSNSVTVVVAP